MTQSMSDTLRIFQVPQGGSNLSQEATQAYITALEALLADNARREARFLNGDSLFAPKKPDTQTVVLLG